MVLGLTPWGQVLYMAIGAGVIVITLIVVTCFLGPGCWGYEWIHRGEHCTVLLHCGKYFLCGRSQLLGYTKMSVLSKLYGAWQSNGAVQVQKLCNLDCG